MLHVQIKGLIVIFREITTFFFFCMESLLKYIPQRYTFKIYTQRFWYVFWGVTLRNYFFNSCCRMCYSKKLHLQKMKQFILLANGIQ